MSQEIYHYDPNTGFYIGADVADESPLEPGVWLIPAHATTVAPPPVSQGNKAVWTGETWLEVTVDPVPPPMTPEEKLSRLGLTVDDLRALLGMTA